MKKIILFLCATLFCVSSVIQAQTFMDYVSSMRGDTAVIKDYTEMGNKAGSLADAMNSDTINVPAGRVYMLKTNGYYPLTSNPTTSASRAIVIVGADSRRIVTNKDANSAPPVICGSIIAGGWPNTGGIGFSSNLTIKNCNMIPFASDGTGGWAFLYATVPNCKVHIENDLFEMTRYAMIFSHSEAGTSLFINDCYFVNLSGQACRRNGVVFDNVTDNTDTIWVENTTHVMAQGSMYKFRQFQSKKLFFNHNTFINCAASIFESLGYVSDLTVTNNIFVNSNVQAFSDSLGVWDAGETDADNLPTGIINCAPLPNNYKQMDRKILVDKNVVYWDPRFNNMDSILIANKVDGTTKWVSQMITMNTRTQAMFDNNTTYPYLTEGVWYKKLPTFTDPKDLLTTQVDNLRAFTLSTVDGKSTAVLPEWRLINSPSQYFVHADWPIPVNLAYTDAALLTGGTNGFPIGDLNWFPTQKAAWVAQKDAEHAALQTALNTRTITIVEDRFSAVPKQFELLQNYPNPFNPSTTISYALSSRSQVRIRIFNTLGQIVSELINNEQAAGYQSAIWNATVASGMYFYRIEATEVSNPNNRFVNTKKMILLK